MLTEIGIALDAGLAYLAILQCLALPDVCGAMEALDGRTSASAYKRWYEKYLWHHFILLTPAECYSLRCGIVHQSRSEIVSDNYKRIVFFHDGWGAYEMSKMIDHEGTLGISIRHFCVHMNNAVHQWYADMRSDPNVIRNIPDLLQPRESDGVYGRMVLR